MIPIDGPSLALLPAEGPPAASTPIPFRNTYVRLPDRFHARVAPTPVAGPGWIKVNVQLARELGIDPAALMSAEGLEILAGNRVAGGSEPLAMAYAGHQFGHFVPQLGDGRANLLGEVIARDGRSYDIQLKGAGPTPFSRRGDGRAALGPVLREYILSEAMAALGVPTTRALAAVTTGEYVRRDRSLPGAVFTRVAASHLRVGSFQYFATRDDLEGLRVLANYAIARHYPETGETAHRYRAFLEGVVERQAGLIAQWMLLGFVHGVMNTDNMSISGETIDYGPCAFLEAYQPGMVFSSIDANGRYAYGNQPHAALWNLTRLAEALLPLLAEEAGGDDAGLECAQGALSRFAPRYEAVHKAGLRRKLGLLTERSGDDALTEDLLSRMAAGNADFTLTFRRLCAAAESADDAGVRTLFTDPAVYDRWALSWHKRLAEEDTTPGVRLAAMHRANPSTIPRNHRVEEVIAAAVESLDFKPFEQLIEATSRPFEDRPAFAEYTLPATPEQTVHATFCGT